MDVHIAGDVEIEKSVAAEVAEGAAGVPFDAASETGGGAYFGEGSVAVVFVEEIDADGGDEDVGEAVVVVVGGIGASAPVSVGEAGALGDVFEVAMAQIVEEVNAAGFGRNGRLAADYAAQ